MHRHSGKNWEYPNRDVAINHGKDHKDHRVEDKVQQVDMYREPVLGNRDNLPQRKGRVGNDHAVISRDNLENNSRGIERVVA